MSAGYIQGAHIMVVSWKKRLENNWDLEIGIAWSNVKIHTTFLWFFLCGVCHHLRWYTEWEFTDIIYCYRINSVRECVGYWFCSAFWNRSRIGPKQNNIGGNRSEIDRGCGLNKWSRPDVTIINSGSWVTGTAMCWFTWSMCRQKIIYHQYFTSFFALDNCSRTVV